MSTQKNKFLKRIFKWRYKHISQKTFIYILSVVVGLLAGLASVTLKNITFFIEALLEKGIIFSSNQLYFILPIVGLTLVYLYVKYVHKERLKACGLFHSIFAIKEQGKHRCQTNLHTTHHSTLNGRFWWVCWSLRACGSNRGRNKL